MSQELKKVLAYHSIEECFVNEAGAQLYCVSLAKFREQIKFIADGSQLTAYSEDKKNIGDYVNQQVDSPKYYYDVARLRAKSHELIITFDDGDITNYTYAYPVLKEFGLKAHFFILVGRVGTEGYMNWDQVKELHRAGMTIGSHGMSHCFLTELNDAELACELTDSKKLLEEVLGTAVDSLSIPRGFYNARVLEKAAQAGYKTVFASDNRIAIKADWDFEHFKYVLRKGYSFGERLQRFVLAAAKVILGPKGYERVRTQLLGKH